jgi:hypothetical protein
MKRLLGRLALIVLCICVAPIPCHLLVALFEGPETLYDLGVYWFLLVPSLLSFISFTVVRSASFLKKKVLWGFILSSLAVVFVPVMLTPLLGEFGLDDMALGFIFLTLLSIQLFPLLLPVFALSWLGTRLVFGRVNEGDADSTKSRAGGHTHAHPA